MQKIFIAYGTGNYKKSLRRISKEARNLGIFSKVITYTEKDMPLCINASPLKAYKNGNGYWVWKPYIIWKTMQDYPNSIIVYADAGCVLRRNMDEWNNWFQLMEKYDTITFQYRADHFYELWEEPEKNRKTTNLEWCKESFIRYFEPMLGRDWLSLPQCWGGAVLACRNSKFIKMWLDITLMRPDLVMDSFGVEVLNPHPMFREHRRDQSICTALSLYWQTQPGNMVKILPETAESQKDTAAIAAVRKCASPNPIPLKTRIIMGIKKHVGEDTYEKYHELLSSNKIVQKIILSIEHKGAKAYRNG